MPWAKCKAHLVEARETYFEHLAFAAGVGLILLAAGIACIVHAIIPGCCTRTASTIVARLNTLFADRRALRSTLDDVSGALTLVGLLALSLPFTGMLLLVPEAPALGGLSALLALGIPVAYLCTNPQLEPVP
jgi:hypothetical protein